ncbi:unnamed protein product [Peniophora sp. CBMAI 1063]|nr:unnamed protein product [Peniophora sp. CBMAI 1063]
MRFLAHSASIDFQVEKATRSNPSTQYSLAPHILHTSIFANMARISMREFMRRQRSTTPPVLKADLSGKVVIVTGANVGLGFEAVKHFARMNPAKIVIACRSQAKGEAALANLKRETGYTRGELRLLDLSDFQSVIRFVEKFEAENERLDILVNNAGIHNFQYEALPTGVEATVQVNHLSTSLLCIRMLSLMHKTATEFNTRPRIVIVTSGTHYNLDMPPAVVQSPRMFDKLSEPQYCANKSVMAERYNLTKLINVFFTRALAAHLPADSPIIVNSANPGFCYSELRRTAPAMLGAFLHLMEYMMARTTEEGSRQYIWAALAGEAGDATPVDKLRGAFVSECRVTEPSSYIFTKEGEDCQRRIWDETIEILRSADPKVSDILKSELDKAQ